MEPNSQEEIQQTEVLTSSSNPEDIAELEISEAVEQPDRKSVV